MMKESTNFGVKIYNYHLNLWKISLKKNMRKYLKLNINAAINDKFNKTAGQAKLLKIMSYNTLAQTLMNRRTTFTYVSKEAGHWKNRRALLVDEIRQIDPDVLCMQEVDFYEEFWIDALKELGYDSVHQPKMNSMREVKQYGLCVAWKHDLLELVDYELLEYQALSEHLTGLKFFELCKSNVAQICGFRVRESSGGDHSNVSFIVTNTHAFWRKNYHYTRLRQICYLFERLRLFNMDRNWPIITLGDFNMTPSSVLYKILTGDRNFTEDDEGIKEFLLPHDLLQNTSVKEIQLLKRNQLEEETGKEITDLPKPLKHVKHASLEWWLEKVHYSLHDASIFDPVKRIEHVIKFLNEKFYDLPELYSVYSNYLELDPEMYPIQKREIEWLKDRSNVHEPPFTHYVKEWCGTLDYCFLAKDSDVNGFQNQYPSYMIPTEILQLLHEPDVNKEIALPNEEIGSDHLPLVVKLLIKPVVDS